MTIYFHVCGYIPRSRISYILKDKYNLPLKRRAPFLVKIFTFSLKFCDFIFMIYMVDFLCLNSPIFLMKLFIGMYIFVVTLLKKKEAFSLFHDLFPYIGCVENNSSKSKSKSK